jgi:hypothetical protein
MSSRNLETRSPPKALIWINFRCAPGSALTCIAVNHGAFSSFSKIAAGFPFVAGKRRMDAFDPIELNCHFLKQLLQSREIAA